MYGWDFSGKEVLFIEITMLGWNPSESHFILTDNPMYKFNFIWPEPVSRVEI